MERSPRLFPQVVTGGAQAALIRFKLLDDRLRTANHTSGQQDALDVHEFTPEMMEQLTFSGVSNDLVPTVLTCGYQLAPDEMSIARVVVTCHYDRELQWAYDVSGELVAEVLTLPGVGQVPQTRVRSRRIEGDSVTGEIG